MDIINNTRVMVIGHIIGKKSIVCQWNADIMRVRVNGDVMPIIGKEITVSYNKTKLSGCPMYASYTSMQIEETLIIDTPATIEEWEARGGITLEQGQSVFVTGRKTYKVTRGRKGDGMYCSCDAWKYQRLHPLCRTCKHCEAVCGKSIEAMRTAVNTVTVLQAKMIK